MSQLAKIYGSISKIEEQDDGTIKVFGVASSETKDASGETVRAAAMSDALPDYSKFPALREMHQPMAAGKVLEAEVDDQGVTHIVAHVVDPVAIVKVRTGVYAGFSIGGKVLKRDPTDRSVITALRLVEISLVDSPCNPDATLSMWKADAMIEFKPKAADVVARAKTLAKAAGTQRFREFLFEAGQELISEHMLKAADAGELDLETGAAPVAEAEIAAADPPAAVVEDPPVAAEPEAVITDPPAAEPGAEVVEAEASAEPVVEAEAGSGESQAEAEATIEAGADAEPIAGADAEPDPAAALADAIVKAGDVIEAAAPADANAEDPFADLAKTAVALRSIAVPAEGEDLAKGLYTVGRFAELLDSFCGVQRSAAWEAKDEGDQSPIPAELAAAIKTLGDILVAMAQEEVGELISDLRDNEGNPIVEIIYCGDNVELAEQIVDLVKADADLMEKIGARNSKRDGQMIQQSHDHMTKLGAVCDKANIAKIDGEEDPELELAAANAEVERLSKALGEAAPAVEELTKRFGETIDGLKGQITELTTKFEALDQTPIPPRTAGPAITARVEKGTDSAGLGGSDGGNGALLSQEQIDEAFAKLSDEEKGQLLIKVALANPTAIRLPTVSGR